MLQRVLRRVTTFGAGLLIGTALIVIIPEGMESLFGNNCECCPTPLLTLLVVCVYIWLLYTYSLVLCEILRELGYSSLQNSCHTAGSDRRQPSIVIKP
jgi:hypothetical protein